MHPQPPDGSGDAPDDVPRVDRSYPSPPDPSPIPPAADDHPEEPDMTATTLARPPL